MLISRPDAVCRRCLGGNLIVESRAAFAEVEIAPPEIDKSEKVKEGAKAAVRLPPRPIFFMHIAKTAGSYLNTLFESALGSERVITHIELKIGGAAGLVEALERGTYVFSGHVMFGLWQDMEGPLGQRFSRVTVVRDPIDHLASHLLWLDHYNLPEKRQEYRALNEAHQRIADRIGAIDLTDLGQLDAFLTNLSAAETRLFDNCQARYFLTSGGRSLDAMRPLSLSDCRMLRRAMAEFDVIARQDRLAHDIPRISQVLGLDLRHTNETVNAAKSERRIDTSNPYVRQVLGKRTLVDQWLWRTLAHE